MISNFKFEAATDWQIEDDSWISKVCERFYIHGVLGKLQQMVVVRTTKLVIV